MLHILLSHPCPSGGLREAGRGEAAPAARSTAVRRTDTSWHRSPGARQPPTTRPTATAAVLVVKHRWRLDSARSLSHSTWPRTKPSTPRRNRSCTLTSSSSCCSCSRRCSTDPHWAAFAAGFMTTPDVCRRRSCPRASPISARLAGQHGRAAAGVPRPSQSLSQPRYSFSTHPHRCSVHGNRRCSPRGRGKSGGSGRLGRCRTRSPPRSNEKPHFAVADQPRPEERREGVCATSRGTSLGTDGQVGLLLQEEIGEGLWALHARDRGRGGRRYRADKKG